MIASIDTEKLKITKERNPRMNASTVKSLAAAINQNISRVIYGKEDKIDLILFIKLDRWTRNVEAYHSVQKILDAHNVSWQTTMEDYETLTANGRFKVNII